MKRVIFVALLLISNLSSLNAQSFLDIGLGFNHAPIYERLFEDKYNFSGSPTIKYQYNWNKKKNRSLRLGLEFVYHQGRAISIDTLFDLPPFENYAIGTTTKYVEINRISTRLFLTHEHNFSKIALYYGGLIQLPFFERSLIKNYTFYNYGQITGDYDTNYEIKAFHPTNLGLLSFFMGKVGVRHNFTSGRALTLDYSIGVNKRHSLFLCYSFQLGE